MDDFVPVDASTGSRRTALGAISNIFKVVGTLGYLGAADGSTIASMILGWSSKLEIVSNRIGPPLAAD